MELFEGDEQKIRAMEADITAQLGFDRVVPVSGQTYSRKVDFQVLSALSGIGQSAMKLATDLRLLANFKEMEEPFEKNQIGSSATVSYTHLRPATNTASPWPFAACGCSTIKK